MIQGGERGAFIFASGLEFCSGASGKRTFVLTSYALPFFFSFRFDSSRSSVGNEIIGFQSCFGSFNF